MVSGWETDGVADVNKIILDAEQTKKKVKEIMEDVKSVTGHYPTRSDLLRVPPPAGVVLTDIEAAYDAVRRA